jgi:CheY-like chemotaxis protein
MKSVIVCSPSKSTSERVATELSRAGFVVDMAADHAEVLALIKEEKRDIVVAEARRDRFAEFLKRLLSIRPGTLVHLFEHDLVFCHYPAQRQPVPLLFALDNAGLNLPGKHIVQPPPATADSVFLNA